MAVLHQRAFLEPFVKNDDLDLDDQEIQKTMTTIVQKRPSQLTEELKLIIQHIIQEEASKKTSNQIETVTNMVITEDTPWVNSLCYIVEQILYHGLKDVSFFGITECWHYIEQLPTCMPGSDHILNTVRDLTKSSLGRGRLFVRVALNEGSLHEYLSALKWNEPLTKKYYHEWSIIRNEEHCGTFFMLVDQLSVVKFSLYLKIKEIGREEYWDIIPLARPQIIVNDRLKDPQKGILQVKAKKPEPSSVVSSEQADTENSTSSLSSLAASHSVEDDLDEIIDKSLRTSQPKQSLQDSRKMEEEQKAKEEDNRKQEAEELNKKKEQERIRQEAIKKQEEEERIKAEIKKEEERRKQAEEISQALEAKRRQQQEDDRIKEEQKRKEEDRQRREEQERKKRQEEEALKIREEQLRVEQEKKRLEEEERQRLEARIKEEERIKEQQKIEEEERIKQEQSSNQDSSDQSVETDSAVVSQPTEEDPSQQLEHDSETLEEERVQDDQAAVEEERRREEERIRQEQRAQELEKERKQREEARRAMEEEQARIREEEIRKALLEEERKMKEEQERQEAARRAWEEEQARIREEQIKQQQEEERRRQEEQRLEEERVKQEEIRKSRELEEQRALEAQIEEERIKREEEERARQIQEEQKAAEEAQKAEPTRIQRIENIVLPTHDDVVAVQRNPSKKKGKRVRIKSKPAAVMPNIEISPQAEPDNEAITSMEKDLQQHHQSIDEMLSTLKNFSSSLKVTSPIAEEEPQPTESIPEQVPQEQESDEGSSDDDSIDEEDYADIDFTQPIPQEWREFTNNDGKKYYYNIYSRVTIWYHPLIYIKKHGLTSIKYEPAVPKEDKVPESTVQEVKAPTVRPAWMPDKSVEACMNCKNKFSLKLRKHHCRSCGQIYCSACCVKIPLPNLRYTKPELVCEKCFKTYYSGTAV